MRDADLKPMEDALAGIDFAFRRIAATARRRRSEGWEPWEIREHALKEAGDFATERSLNDEVIEVFQVIASKAVDDVMDEGAIKTALDTFDDL